MIMRNTINPKYFSHKIPKYRHYVAGIHNLYLKLSYLPNIRQQHPNKYTSDRLETNIIKFGSGKWMPKIGT